MDIIIGVNIYIMLILMMSIVIGISMESFKGLSWIQRFNLDNFIIVFITLYYNNIILILGLIGFIICGINSNNNKILLMHWTLIIINTIYLNNNINNNLMNNNLINIIFIVLIIDIISVINIIFIKRGEGIWYYFLYQSIITVLIWWFIIIDNLYILGLLYYYKLGSGICGYYIPNLYYNIMNYNLKLMLYVGTTNIILMYNPIFLLSTITSYHSDYLYIMILSNFIMVIAILYIWVYNGYIFVNNWLYCISFSTIILSNIYFLFIYVDFIYYNLYYYIYYFTITSIIIWYIMILTLYFIL